MINIKDIAESVKNYDQRSCVRIGKQVVKSNPDSLTSPGARAAEG